MIIIYNDGGSLECECIEISGGTLFADDVWSISVGDVAAIVDGYRTAEE